MRAQLKTHGGRLMLECEAADIKDLFRAVGRLQDAFDSDQDCGACHSTDIKFRVRSQGGFEFYELHCNACRADLAFGIQKGTESLYAKRFAEKGGGRLPNNGWIVYNGPTGEQNA